MSHHVSNGIEESIRDLMGILPDGYAETVGEVFNKSMQNI